jgi:hypothetical protein
LFLCFAKLMVLIRRNFQRKGKKEKEKDGKERREGKKETEKDKTERKAREKMSGIFNA